MNTDTMTTIVEPTTSFLGGQLTFRISVLTSFKNRTTCSHRSFIVILLLPSHLALEEAPPLASCPCPLHHRNISPPRRNPDAQHEDLRPAHAKRERLGRGDRARSSQPRGAFTWQARRDLNPQPPDLESGALPLELLAYGFLRGGLCRPSTGVGRAHPRFARNSAVPSIWTHDRIMCGHSNSPPDSVTTCPNDLERD